MTKVKKRTTRDEIIYAAAKLFLKNGFSETSAKMICDELHISTGNLTYYFSTKEQLFCVIVQELCQFQWEMFLRITSEGRSALLAVCLELAAMAAVCEENPVAHDLYLSSYAYPMTLDCIRKADCQRAKQVFADFCTDWDDADFEEAEMLTSGIEYATLVHTSDALPLEQRIRSALNGIMLLYQVPEALRASKVEKILSMDYRSLGRNIFREFAAYLLQETGEPERTQATT